jgi:glycosyltransferase involved in cell wall biosynthesis
VRHWVYYCVDDLGEWPGLDKETLQRMERDLVSRVDEVVAVSRGLVERMASLGRSATLLTHGVDLEHWQQGEANRLKDFDSLARPVVVFWGVVDRRLESSWLGRLAEKLGSGSIVLVGPTNNPDPRLQSTSGVFLQGPMPYESLPALASLASVLIMPYADLPATRAMQPLKLKEYLATDRPVVVSDLPAMNPWRDACDAVCTADDFAEAVIRRLRTGLPEDQQSARERLRGETWSHKAEVFEEILLGAAGSCVEQL